ncbi:obgE [Mytilus coruscus]|uniref:ObgE n=1 Tax=Mytilus coruscus TaxID=42192 RepID=A0A6J8CJV7_MYTCO|nr:obgE [Mytilus coruscus]
MANAGYLLTYSKIAMYFKRDMARLMSTAQPLKPHKAKSKINRKTFFVDFKKVKVTGGTGGNGVMCFTSEKNKEFCGPDGGDGGNGGHVVLKASKDIRSLNHLKTVINGNTGVKGRSKNCHGKNAEHLYVKVPQGTIVRNEEGKMLTSLDEEHDYYIAARGGSGGRGNRFFLTDTNTAPAKAELGAEGESRQLMLELRIMANAGLIGFPNAGKSTLLRAISRAKPKVSPIPFTTMNPHIGMVGYDDYVQIAVADIPGLIKDAHKNRGLGISFLRHIERCACLLYVIDLSVSEPWTQLNDLKHELDQYKPGLSARPHAVIGNKIDLPGAKDNLRELTLAINLPVYPVAAKHRIGIDSLLTHLRYMYDKYGAKEDIEEDSTLVT